MIAKAQQMAAEKGGMGLNPNLERGRSGDESSFQSWYQQQAKQYDLNPNPDDPQQFYDYRAAFRAGAKPDASGHWPSDFKREGHPNMVVGGFNVKTGQRVPGTKQASREELIRLGWSPEDADRMTRENR